MKTAICLPEYTFITSGILPVPATEGGAVEGLVEQLIYNNERSHRCNFKVITIWSAQAEIAARNYSNTQFIFLRAPRIILLLDNLLFSIAKNTNGKRNISAYRYVFQRLWYLWAVSAILADEDCGKLIIENHPSLYLTLKLRGNSTKYRGKYFYHLHNVFDDFYGCKEIAKQAKGVLSISRFVQESYASSLNGLIDKQKLIFRNCVDCSAFSRQFSAVEISDFKLSVGLKSDDFVFMFSGRITPEKGVRELLEAFALAVPSMPNARLLIVGAAFFGSDVSSEYESSVLEIAAKLRDLVVFSGYMEHANINIAYASSDVCCFPSMWEEPACLSVLEGLASGRPVISTISGGIPEYVGEGNALLLDKGPGFVNRLSDAMIKLYNDSDLRDLLGKRGRRRALKFDSDLYLDSFLACIEHVEDY